MKKLIALSLLACSIGTTSCVTTSTPQRGNTDSTSNARTMSVEAEARKKTEDMNTLLSLSAAQKDEVMVANTVYFKILKNLRDNNETSKISSATESYKKKIKSILTTEQYSKFEGMDN